MARSDDEVREDTRRRQEAAERDLARMRADRAARGGWLGDVRETLWGTVEDVVIFVVMVAVVGGGVLVGRAADDSATGMIAGAAIGVVVALVLLAVRAVVRRR